AITQAEADAHALVFGAVLDVGGGEGAGDQRVQAFGRSPIGARDHATDETRIAPHIDLKACVPRLDSALLGDAREVRVDAVEADVQTAAPGCLTHRDAPAEAQVIAAEPI